MKLYDNKIHKELELEIGRYSYELSTKRIEPSSDIPISMAEQEKYYYSWTGGGKNKKIIDIRELTDTSAVKLNNYLISHNLYSGTLFAHYLQKKAGKLVRIMEYDELPF